MSKQEVGYAAALKELEKILDELQDENIDIDKLGARVKRAAELIGICRGRINAAQVQVNKIVADLGDVADDDEG